MVGSLQKLQQLTELTVSLRHNELGLGLGTRSGGDSGSCRPPVHSSAVRWLCIQRWGRCGKCFLQILHRSPSMLRVTLSHIYCQPCGLKDAKEPCQALCSSILCSPHKSCPGETEEKNLRATFNALPVTKKKLIFASQARPVVDRVVCGGGFVASTPAWDPLRPPRAARLAGVPPKKPTCLAFLQWRLGRQTGHRCSNAHANEDSGAFWCWLGLGSPQGQVEVFAISGTRCHASTPRCSVRS